MQSETEIVAMNRKSLDRKLMVAAGLFVLVLLAFYPASRLGFTTYDDPEYVTANPYVHAGLTWTGIKWAFASHGANWHPVTWLSHLLDGQLFGLNPWGHHLENVIWHAANVGLAFLLINALTGAAWRSAIVALVFGLHPFRVESVAWIAERKDVLSTFFFFLSLLAYVRFVKLSQRDFAFKKSVGEKPQIFYLLALLCCAFGLMSKSMVVTLPCVLLLLDFWPLERFSRTSGLRILLEKLPFFLLAGAMSAVAWLAQYHGTALVSDLPLGLRLENALVSYARYLGKIFWPVGLSPIYPYPHAWPIAMVAASAVILIMISSLTIWQTRPRPYLAMGWFWFLGTLVPVIGVIQVGNQSLADRYTYIPSLGIIFAVVWLVADLGRHWKIEKLMASVASAGLTLVLFSLTRQQIPYWQNSEAMFQRAVNVTSNNTLALIGLGDCLVARGQTDIAIEQYEKAIAASPEYYEAHNNLGLALLQKQECNRAVSEFSNAITCRPGAIEAHINLAVALAQSGNLDAASGELESVVAANPTNVLAHTDLGSLYLQRKKAGKAVAEFRLASNLAPKDAAVHDSLGAALAVNGQTDDAIAEFKEALALNPGLVRARDNLTRATGMK